MGGSSSRKDQKANQGKKQQQGGQNQEGGRRRCGSHICGKAKKRKKKDLSKVKCFHCGELGHYATQCPRKKSKGEASETKVAPSRVEKEVETDDDCAMSAHAPLERKWGDIEL